MSIPSDHKALIFLATVAVLGTGVRALRAAGSHPSVEAQPALDHQMQAADSSANAGHAHGQGRGRKPPARARPDTNRQRALRDSIDRTRAGPRDRPGYIDGKLDLDVATVAQIDSLPGVTPLMARRMVLDRMSRGPFLNANGLRRVTGAGPAFVAALIPLVVFSGTVVQPTPGDTTPLIRAARRGAARAIRPPSHPPP